MPIPYRLTDCSRRSAAGLSLGLALLWAGAGLLPGGLAAQEVTTLPELPAEVAEWAVARTNDPSTLRFTARSRIPSGVELIGNVAVLGGPFEIAGTLRGDLLVINGEVRLVEGARVTGEVVVVGGRVVAAESASIGGGIRLYEPLLSYTFRGDDIERVDAGRRSGVSSPLGAGQSRFTVRAGQNYNRVEGLPVLFGPILETEGRNPLRLEALGIWRTESGFALEVEDLGYEARIEQSIGGRDELAFGLGVYSRIRPIESWGISNLEASLATFVLHRDFRDYFEEEGWNAFLEWRPRRSPLRLSAEYRSSSHGFVAPRGPWSLRRNDRPWRPQPAVADGRLGSVELEVEYDARNDRKSPSDGWFLHGTLLRSAGVELEWPELFGPEAQIAADGAPVTLSIPVPSPIRHGFADVRSHHRTGPSSIVSLRGVAAGSLDRSPLPPQLQHAIGGVGTLSGHPLLSVDCGAREAPLTLVRRDGDARPVYGQYGCDRLLFLQAEFRSSAFSPSGMTSAGSFLPYPLRMGPAWSLTLSGGQGWTARRESLSAPLRGANTGWHSDVALGVHLGDLGAQVALPLRGHSGGATFSIRLNRPF